MKKKIIILGATGSIGKSTLHIVKKFKDRFDIVGVSAHHASPGNRSDGGTVAAMLRLS